METSLVVEVDDEYNYDSDVSDVSDEDGSSVSDGRAVRDGFSGVAVNVVVKSTNA
jgi:hypothetical protein